MATVRDGDQTALLVVDVQVGVMATTWEPAPVIQKIGLAVEKARNANIPVIWVKHADAEIVYGSPNWEVVPELSPNRDEQIVHKEYNSSFEQTDLEEKLAMLGISHLILGGAATNWCIRSTAHGALERGYDLTLLADAHTTVSIELDEDISVQAADIIQELNIAMTWMDYPGRKNRAISVEALDF